MMDRLLAETPDLTPARMLRARYFVANSQLEAAFADLEQVSAKDTANVEVVTLKARVLNELGRHDDAAQLIEPLLEDDPREPVLLSLLAEIRLYQERGADAQVLVDRALGEQARFPRALYVRGRSLEQGGNLDAAVTDYETSVRSDPAFFPPLTRLWGLYLKRGDKGEAMAALERLLFMGEITGYEKVELVKLYDQTGANLTRAKALITEALKREPKNPQYLKLKARIDKALAPSRPPGIIIMKHR